MSSNNNNNNNGGKQGGGGNANQGSASGGMTNLDKEMLSHLNNMDQDSKHKKDVDDITGAFGKLSPGGGGSSGGKK